MKKGIRKNVLLGFLLLFTKLSLAQIEFSQHLIVPEGANTWWARSHADINNDGLLDFFVIDNNAQGGALLWYETVPGFGHSKKHVIADRSPEGATFAAGDLAAGDIDNDGDIDVLGPVSPGEWGGAQEPLILYWYENPGWIAHKIGVFPSLVKDFDLVDLNADGKLDVAATTHVDRKMFVFRQDSPEKWAKAAEVYVEHLHEGQHVGDVDGDGDIDVVSTGYCFFNPGGDMTDPWMVRNIDPYWNTDDAYSWEYNATKIFCADIDNDKRDEVFISCSEKFRTRVAWYKLDTSYTDKWIRHEIGQNAFAHTLQVGDMDNDGDLDVISGNNGDQGDPDYSPVILFFQGTGAWWEIWSNQQVLTLQGAYNSYIGDVEGDGDLDFFRYDGHVGTSYELWLNNTISK
ncbi:MAG: FG-GAP repeat domain-containing protein [Candidatus Cyclobacteriaceae bacterium M3_2C_046]